MFRPCSSGWRDARQAHRKDRTFAQFARHGHIATHHARELAGDGEPKPRPAELLCGRGIGLAELLEQLCLLLRSHANTATGYDYPMLPTMSVRRLIATTENLAIGFDVFGTTIACGDAVEPTHSL